ncbi:hypothetical protein SKAU_G00140430 [Synaphobranchus kaupii]|uniref:Uncharacterized protein n=1 Tax=Synaphobranchus kaupii TaxID=118154 RepID=A0A9Q1FS71_SYNKA|nr:hypothetical protein SKAU_G00140430 [Synaphobranchus kaupii]
MKHRSRPRAAPRERAVVTRKSSRARGISRDESTEQSVATGCSGAGVGTKSPNSAQSPHLLRGAGGPRDFYLSPPDIWERATPILRDLSQPPKSADVENSVAVRHVRCQRSEPRAPPPPGRGPSGHSV